MLDVAEARFADAGFYAVTMEEIAEAAGISKPMVYAYFESKEGLYLACMARARAQLFEAIDAATSVADAPDLQLWHGILAFLTFVEEHRDAWSVLFAEANDNDGALARESVRVREHLARLIHQLLGEASAAGGIEGQHIPTLGPLAYALIGAAESVAHWWIDHPDQDKEAIALWLTNFAWTGFGDLIEGRWWSPES